MAACILFEIGEEELGSFWIANLVGLDSVSIMSQI